MEFKKLKELICQRAKERSACASEYKRALSSKNKIELLTIIKENIVWCYRNTDCVTIEILEHFGNSMCNELGVYYKGVEKKIKDKKDLIFLGDFKCEMFDSSQVGEMFDSSQVGEMWGRSQVGKMWGSSQVGKMWGSSQVGEMFDSSQVGKMFDSSQVGKMWGRSQVGEMFDSSTVRIGKGIFAGNYKNIKSQNNNSQIIDLQNSKIYIKKSKFEIVEI